MFAVAACKKICLKCAGYAPMHAQYVRMHMQCAEVKVALLTSSALVQVNTSSALLFPILYCPNCIISIPNLC